MLIRLLVLALLSIPSITATLLSRKQIADALKGAKDEELEKIFKDFESAQNRVELVQALVEVAQDPVHMPKVATCLRVARDPFPKENPYASFLVHNTLYQISQRIPDTESVASAIASFKVSDTKLLASIRYHVLLRKDALDILKRVMDKSPDLIINTLPSWLASHELNQSSWWLYDSRKAIREQVFQYLTSFAAESVLEAALSILKKNVHYKVDSCVMCCDSHNSTPQNLSKKLSTLLERVEARNALTKEILLILMPKVLMEITLNYLQIDTV